MEIFNGGTIFKNQSKEGGVMNRQEIIDRLRMWFENYDLPAECWEGLNNLEKSLKEDTEVLDCAINFGSQVETDRQEYKDGLISGHRYLSTLETFFDNMKKVIKQAKKGEK